MTFALILVGMAVPITGKRSRAAADPALGRNVFRQTGTAENTITACPQTAAATFHGVTSTVQPYRLGG